MGWLQPSHLSVSTRSLLSGSFRFLKKQSEEEFSLGSLAPSTLQTHVRLGLGTCHQWVGRTHAQMLLASHLQANTAVPHTGSLTAPDKEPQGVCPSPHSQRSMLVEGAPALGEEGVAVQAHGPTPAASLPASIQAQACYWDESWEQISVPITGVSEFEDGG